MSVMPSIYGVEFRIDQFSHFIPSQGCNEQHLDCLRTDFLSVREITSVFACSDDLVLEILKNVQAKRRPAARRHGQRQSRHHEHADRWPGCVRSSRDFTSISPASRGGLIGSRSG
jgi:hypothetical protein